MPIYEYLCSSCDDFFEVIQKMSDKPLRKCKKCSGKLEKQISRAAFQLKGDGWFASGYSKTAGKSSDKSSDKPSDKSSDESTSAVTKSKKDAKPKPGSGSDTKGQLSSASA